MKGISLSYFLGILVLQVLPQCPEVSGFALFTLCLFLFYLLGHFKIKIQYALTCIMVGLVGFSWALMQVESMIQSWLPTDLVSKTIEVQGVIDSIPVYRDHSNDLENPPQSVHFYFLIDRVLSTGVWHKPGRVALRWHNPPIIPGVGRLRRTSRECFGTSLS